MSTGTVGFSGNDTLVDVNNDGVLDTVSTTVIYRDVDMDGIADVTETSTITVDGVTNDVIKSSINIVSNMVGLTGSTEINLVPTKPSSQVLLDEIAQLQSGISCDKTKHLGTMTDYLELFQKAQEYMTTFGDRNINLLVDTTVLENFANEAQTYSEMFEEVSVRFQTLSTVDDTQLLTKIRDNLIKIKAMYDSIKRFHAIITAESILQIPESIRTVTESLQAVTAAINCSLPYLEYFADNTTQLTEQQLLNAQLSAKDQIAIQSALNALNLWVSMVTNETTVAMSGNAYVQTFKNKIAEYDLLNSRLTTLVDKVRTRLDRWKAGNFN